VVGLPLPIEVAAQSRVPNLLGSLFFLAKLGIIQLFYLVSMTFDPPIICYYPHSNCWECLCKNIKTLAWAFFHGFCDVAKVLIIQKII
jgi:hypothetical protein